MEKVNTKEEKYKDKQKERKGTNGKKWWESNKWDRKGGERDEWKEGNGKEWMITETDE